MKGRPTNPTDRAKWTNEFLVTNINKCIRTDFGGNNKTDTIAKRLCEDSSLQKYGIGIMKKDPLQELAEIVRKNARYHTEASRSRCKQLMVELLLRLNTGKGGDLTQLNDEELIDAFHSLIRMQYPHSLPIELLKFDQKQSNFNTVGLAEGGKSMMTTKAWIAYKTDHNMIVIGVVDYLQRALKDDPRLAVLLTAKAKSCFGALVNFTIAFTRAQLDGSIKRIGNSLEEATLRLKNKPSLRKDGFSLGDV